MKLKYNRVRRFINDIHLWLGLASGLILFIVCLSGTALTFEHEIKSIYFSNKLDQNQTFIEEYDIDKYYSILRAEFPSAEISSVTIPAKKNELISFRVKEDPNARRGKEIYINPIKLTISEQVNTPFDGFFSIMFRLHRWLLLDTKIGRPIVGVATIIFLLISMTGVILWFPKKIKWNQIKQGLKIKTDAKWKRINHDLHNTLGFYACIFLVIMSLSGLCWSFEWYKTGLGNVLNAQVFKGNSSTYNFPNVEVISKNSILEITNNEFNYEGETSIRFPNEGAAGYEISKKKSDFITSNTSNKLILATNGDVIGKQLFKDKTLGEQIAVSIKPIHTGEIFGWFSKLIYFIACLIATSLPITGTLIWVNKMKK